MIENIWPLPVLETERTILQPWKLEYAEEMLTFTTNEEVIRLSDGWKLIDTVKKAERKIKKFIDGKANEWAITIKQSGENKIVGSIGFNREQLKLSNYKIFGFDDSSGDTSKSFIGPFGYLIAKSYWGQGIATEAALRVMEYAFTDLKTDVITTAHKNHNARSKRVIEKCGFKFRDIFPKNKANDPESRAYYFLTLGDYAKLREMK